MTQLVNPMIFYWIEFFEKLGLFLGCVSFITIIISMFIIYRKLDDEDYDKNKYVEEFLCNFKEENRPKKPEEIGLLTKEYYQRRVNMIRSTSDVYDEIPEKIKLLENEYSNKLKEFYSSVTKQEEILRKEFIVKVKKEIKKPLIAITISLLLFTTTVFIPSRDTMYKMLVASYVTSENYEFAKDELTDLVDYIVGKFKGE